MNKILLLLMFLIQTIFALDSGGVLGVDKAFKPSIKLDKTKIETKVDLAQGIYVYKDKLKYQLIEPKKMDLTKHLKLPKAIKHDEFIVFMKNIDVDIPLKLIKKEIGDRAFKLQISYQGCSTKGLCYPPQNALYAFDKDGKIIKNSAKKDKKQENVWGVGDSFELNKDDNEDNKNKKKTIVSTDKMIQNTTPLKSKEEKKHNSTTDLSKLDQNQIIDILKHRSFFVILGIFFLLGLGLAFTPCIFPMIPILSSIITLESKQRKNMSAKRGLFLSFIYIVSSALVYAIAGILSAMFGSNILSALQNPWVIVIFSLIFIALAFSMFGYYEIQLPKSLQNFANRKSEASKGNGIIGVAIMGALSALIVGPCVAPPLAAALIFIGQTGDIVLGGFALFLLGLGMGAPLLLIGLGGGKFMPKPGGWMTKVSYIFGVVMLGIAISFLSRILPPQATMLLWSLLFIASGVYAGALEPFKEGVSGISKFIKVIAVLLLAYGLILLLGSFLKGESLLEPLKNLTNKTTYKATSSSKPEFKIVSSKLELAKEIASAKKPVLIDFSAKWCAACKELEEETFSDEKVKELMSNFKLIRVDVTKNSDEDKKLQKTFGIVGPPAIIFYSQDKKELKSHQVVGFKPANEFIKILNEVLNK